VDNTDSTRTAASFAALTGGDADWRAWRRLHAATGLLAARVAPTLTQPLLSEAGMRERVGDSRVWDLATRRPLGQTLTEDFGSDTVRGVIMTDAVVGTFVGAADPGLGQNRCWLYHVIGNGTGLWNVPVGGMGRLSAALAEAATAVGAQIRTGAEVTAIDPDGAVSYRDAGGGEHEAGAGHVLANVAPVTLDRLMKGDGEAGGGPGTAVPEGSQLKINMVLARLPRLRDRSVPATDAFCGTFHVNEGYAALEAAYEQAARGEVPAGAPCEAYCHSLTDDSIIGPGLRAAGVQTLTVFGPHMPARLFRADPAAAKQQAFDATMASINSVLAERSRTAWQPTPAASRASRPKPPPTWKPTPTCPAGTSSTATCPGPTPNTPKTPAGGAPKPATPGILVCGAGSRRGGGVSGIGGHNAAMAILRARS
jgi:phytoene dehydrogenase-like protein